MEIDQQLKEAELALTEAKQDLVLATMRLVDLVAQVIDAMGAQLAKEMMQRREPPE